MVKKIASGFTDIFVKYKKIFLIIFLCLIFFRLWLFLTMNWEINMATYHDSRLQVNLASDMVWGGDYNKFVLCKGLAFPIFLTVSNLLRLPYPVCLFLLAVLASFLFARCLKPIVKNKTFRMLIFLFLLYSPIGLGGGMEAAYPYRDALVPWTVLVIISCIVAIFLRRKAEVKKLWPWCLVGLLFTGFFWNLREDSVWFLPFILVGALVTILCYFIKDKNKKKKEKKDLKVKVAFVFVALSPLISIFLWNTGISFVNQIKYGIYTTQDRTKTYEAKVIGQLIKIDDGVDLENDLWVSDEALNLAKEASPTLTSLDLESFDRWPKHGDYSIWALRDAAEASGYYVDANETNEMYKKIYDELEQSFKDGVLKKKNGIQLTDTSGIYTLNEMTRPIGDAFGSIIKHITYDEYNVELEKLSYVNSEGDIVLYENVLGINLLRTDEELEAIDADTALINANNNLRKYLRVNKKISNMLVTLYNVIGWVFFVISIVGFIFGFYAVVFKKDYKNYKVEIIVTMAGLLLSAFLNAYMVSLWGMTGFGISASSGLFEYTTAETMLICCFEIFGVCAFWMMLKNIKKGGMKWVKK